MTKYEFSYARRIFDGVAGATARKSNEADGNSDKSYGQILIIRCTSVQISSYIQNQEHNPAYFTPPFFRKA